MIMMAQIDDPGSAITEIGDVAFLRYAHRDLPASQLVATRIAERNLPVTLMAASVNPHDYTLIEAQLDVAAVDNYEVLPPADGSGYGAFTPRQRGRFLEWAENVEQPAPTTFQQLWLAHAEVRLFESEVWHLAAGGRLAALDGTPAWAGSLPLQRTLLLAGWLEDRGETIMGLVPASIEPALLGIALGMQALQEKTLTAEQLSRCAYTWLGDSKDDVDDEVSRSRLASLIETLGGEPLAVALATMPQESLSPSAWRTVHRDLRIALPQPDLRRVLEPALHQVYSIAATHAEQNSEPTTAQVVETDPGASFANKIVLEFGEGRSELFDYVLMIAQRYDTFQQILDEDRRLIYRITFEKGKLRNFWRIWDCVRNWKQTRIYVDGAECEKWKIWPYSPNLK